MVIWKDIKGYEKSYQISNTGLVRSLNRLVPRGVGFIVVKGRIMKCSKDKDGYSLIGLRNGLGKKTFKVHRLVLAHFNPLNKELQVNHIDGNKENNNLLNLEWCTREDNIKHATKTGLINQKGEKNNANKLSKEEIIKVKDMYKQGLLQKDIAKEFNVTQTCISAIITGKNWSGILW